MNSVQEKEYKNKMVKYQTKYVQRNRGKVADRKRKYVRNNISALFAKGCL